MHKVIGLLRNRDFIMILALACGLLWGNGAKWTEPLTLPGLALVMTLSTTAVSGGLFRSPKTMLVPLLSGVVMNYLILGGFLLGINAFLIHDEAIESGFVLVAAVPPAVAVLPYTVFLKGNNYFSLLGTIGAYLSALILTPLMAVSLLGTGFVHPAKIVTIMVELILVPLVASRVLVRTGIANRIEPLKGSIVNWTFFLITYTIVGLNRNVFLSHPFSLLPVATVALASTFFLGWLIDRVGRMCRVEAGTRVSLLLLGTLKNYGLAGGLALTLFGNKTALPATVSTVFMIVYIIWLQLKLRSRT